MGTPRGQETELMGIFLFFINGFVWLPPIIVTVINEAGLTFRFIMPVLGLFDFVALIALCCMGDFEKAKEAAEKISNERMIAEANTDVEGLSDVKNESTPIDDNKSTDTDNGKDTSITELSTNDDVSQDV